VRVAYVCSDPGVPVFGSKGCSVHVQEVLRAMLELGIEVVLFARRFDSDPPPELDAITIQPLPPLPKQEARARERAALAANDSLRSALEAAGPFDWVYERYALWSFAAMEYAHAAGIPGLLEVNTPLVEEQAEHRALVDRAGAVSSSARTFRAATHLIAVSREVAEYLGTFADSGERIHVVANGVDPERFHAGVRPTLPPAPGSFTLGFVGSLRPWHGLSVLAESFAQLYQADRASRLIVVGDGPERPWLASRLAARGVYEATQFVGQVAPHEVPGLLASLDVAIAPYPRLRRFYFSPLKVYEYMAAGLAVVASGVGQLEELIESEVNGILCPPGDTKAHAEALERLRSQPALRARLGRAARATIEREHSWSAVVRRLLALTESYRSETTRAAGAAP